MLCTQPFTTGPWYGNPNNAGKCLCCVPSLLLLVPGMAIKTMLVSVYVVYPASYYWSLYRNPNNAGKWIYLPWVCEFCISISFKKLGLSP